MFTAPTREHAFRRFDASFAYGIFIFSYHFPCWFSLNYWIDFGSHFGSFWVPLWDLWGAKRQPKVYKQPMRKFALNKVSSKVVARRGTTLEIGSPPSAGRSESSLRPLFSFLSLVVPSSAFPSLRLASCLARDCLKASQNLPKSIIMFVFCFRFLFSWMRV